MKMVVVELQAAGPDEIAAGVAVVQRRTGSNSWEFVESFALKSNDTSTKRTILLDENERVVIEAVSNIQSVYDPQQNMVRNVNVGEPNIPKFSEADLMIVPGPLPEGTESQIGVWREADEQDWSRTGKRYRIY